MNGYVLIFCIPLRDDLRVLDGDIRALGPFHSENAALEHAARLGYCPWKGNEAPVVLPLDLPAPEPAPS